MSATPSSIAVMPGESQSVSISATASNGFSGTINVSVSGLPAGVTANPGTFNLTPGNAKEVTLSASQSAATGDETVTFHGVSGSLSHDAMMTLTVALPVTASAATAHPPLQMRYIRTNSYYNPNALEYSPPHFAVYDAVHGQFFVSNPYLNEIDVFSGSSEVETAKIQVPGAWGLDISPITGNLYAGTLFGDVYEIDTATLKVIQRYLAASIGPKGFGAQNVMALANGELALQGGYDGFDGGFGGADGYGEIAVWNVQTNSLDTGQYGSVCVVGGQGAMTLSGDRTRILVSTVDEGGGGEPICSYDPTTQVATYTSFAPATFVREIIPTPDGAHFFLTTNLDGVVEYDAKTLQQVGQITGTQSATLPNAAAGAVMSPDGSTLYLLDEETDEVAAYNTTTLQQTGWVPSFKITDSQSGLVISAMAPSGVIIGSMGHGVGFIDASQMQASEPTMIDPGISKPPTGPTGGGTQLGGFASVTPTDSAQLQQIYVGSNQGLDASLVTGVQSDGGSVMTPPSSQAGPADIAVTLSDGGAGIVPEAFSYGPTILEVVPNGATADGGQTGALIGYGFGSDPSAIQVTVGGVNAPVTALYPGAPIEPYPFPTDGLQFTIPPGTAGSAVDVSVTTPYGTTVAKGAFHYIAAAKSFPLSVPLEAGLYDTTRQLYYFTSQSQIQVFSPSAGAWLTPITLPGTGSNTQLMAIAESPDGTKLAVSDYGDQAIYVLDPDNPTSVQRYPMSLDQDGFASLLAPDGLAITNSGIVYFATNDIGGTGTPAFHKLDTAAATITDLGGFSSGGTVDKFDRILLSSDGSHAYGNIEGGVFSLDTSDDQLHYRSINVGILSGSFPDLAVSTDGSTVEAEGFFMDSSLNAESDEAYIDWETWLPTGVGGQELNADGSILYQPLTDGIDLIARNTGRLLYRIQIPDGPASVYDPLVVGPGGNRLAVITSTGISLVDLSSLTYGSQYSQPFPAARGSSAGSGYALYRRQSKPRRILRHAILAHRPELKFRK